MTNQEIRRRYRLRCNGIRGKLRRLEAEGHALSALAKRAWQLRHDALFEARQSMAPWLRRFAEARSTFKYGSPDGPTFERLVATHVGRGIPKPEAPGKIIESASRTNRAVDSLFG